MGRSLDLQQTEVNEILHYASCIRDYELYVAYRVMKLEMNAWIAAQQGRFSEIRYSN